MENATQALLIAAGVLIGIMILSLGVTLFAELSSYVETSHNEIRFNELNSFNTQFLKYQGSEDNPIILTIHDVITVANLANENNSSYNLDETSRGNDSIFYVEVVLKNGATEESIEDGSPSMVDLLNEHANSTFSCSANDSNSIQISQKTGRVFKIVFTKNNP